MTILRKMPNVFSCDGMSVSLVDSNDSRKVRIYTRNCNNGTKIHEQTVNIELKDQTDMYNNPHSLFIDGNQNIPHYLEPLAMYGSMSFLVFPIFFNKELTDIISLGYIDQEFKIEENLDQARQLVDQVGVALSNARLIKELEQFSLGTLVALASLDSHVSFSS